MRDCVSLTPLWRGLALILVPSVLLVGLEIYQLAQIEPRLRASQALVWWIRNSPPNSLVSLRAKRSNLDKRMLYLPQIASSAYGLLAMT
jgi:hypothetical protein